MGRAAGARNLSPTLEQCQEKWTFTFPSDIAERQGFQSEVRFHLIGFRSSRPRQLIPNL
jgi:hypothetical protein